MTDRERNHFACSLAEPLWEMGYEVRRDCRRDDATERGHTLFSVRRNQYCLGIAVTDEFMLRIRTREVAQAAIVREVEQQFGAINV